MQSDENGKKTEVDIRQMEIDDLASVYHLGEELFNREEFPILYRTWDAFEVTDHFTSDQEYCMVAEADGRVVGFVLATTIEKEGTAWKKYGYLSWIGINDDFQRTGLGRRLYRRLEQELQRNGARMVIADTEAENDDALAFFDSLGFSISRRHVWLGKTLRRRAKAKEPADGPALASPKHPGGARRVRRMVKRG
jgi:ribosomal protein S18 acetylase RimI-like enzyme